LKTKEGIKSRYTTAKRTQGHGLWHATAPWAEKGRTGGFSHYNAATVSSTTANPLRPRIPEPKYPQRKKHRKAAPDYLDPRGMQRRTCIQASSRVGSGRTFLVNPRRSTGPTFMYTASHQDATKQRCMGMCVGSWSRLVVGCVEE
jgi:hypothetical protein